MKLRAIFPVAAIVLMTSTLPLWSADTKFVPPVTPRVTYNFNADWKFIRQDVPGAEVVGFDDAAWETVSTPHTFNDVDSFRMIIDHSGGDRGKYQGVVWYRKHFRLPAAAAGSKVFIEFEGMRQSCLLYTSSRRLGFHSGKVSK